MRRPRQQIAAVCVLTYSPAFALFYLTRTITSRHLDPTSQNGFLLFGKKPAVTLWLSMSNSNCTQRCPTVLRLFLRNSSFVALALLATVGALYGQQAALDGPIQSHYAANLNIGDTVINISNTGANGASLYGPGWGSPVGSMCVNVYTFAPEEQLISCCSCYVTPNALVSLSASSDLLTNTLTGLRPSSVTVMLVASATGIDPGTGAPSYSGGSSSCANSAAGVGGPFPLAPAGLAAWGTNIHLSNDTTTSFRITESPFRQVTLNDAALLSMSSRCAFIIGNGSGFGICRSCSPGGRGANRR